MTYGARVLVVVLPVFKLSLVAALLYLVSTRVLLPSRIDRGAPVGTDTTDLLRSEISSGGNSSDPFSWGGCIDPYGQPADDLVHIGRKTTICITLSSSADWNRLGNNPAHTIRLSFQPTADRYAEFYVPESFQDLIIRRAVPTFDGTNDLTIHASSQRITSIQRLWYSLKGRKVYPHLTAIIEVDQGRVTNIIWDDDCQYCSDHLVGGGSQCEENSYDFDGNALSSTTKGCPRTDCSGAGGTGAPCDLKVAVLWTGTDVKGMPLRSRDRSRYKATCDIPVDYFKGVRVLNGNHQIVVPRMNPDGTDADFHISQIKDMSEHDVFYYRMVSNEGIVDAGCGSSAAFVPASAMFGLVIVVVATLIGVALVQ